MHRVELKVKRELLVGTKVLPFLMHRVELKVFSLISLTTSCASIPNVPCGIEKELSETA